MGDIEEYTRIAERPNVVGILVVNSDGICIKCTPGIESEQVIYANNISALAAKARHCVRDLDPTNDLTFLRIRSRRHEYMVAPDKEFILIVIQKLPDNGGAEYGYQAGLMAK